MDGNEYVKHQQVAEQKRVSLMGHESLNNSNELNPFESATGVNNSRDSGRGSGLAKSLSIDSSVVPPHFYSEDYKLDRQMLQLQSQEEISLISCQL